jgi:hypothetical protein
LNLPEPRLFQHPQAKSLIEGLECVNAVRLCFRE